ncbi:MAG: GNAT family N-acetyltransferase [Pseudomonadota bacterium]
MSRVALAPAGPEDAGAMAAILGAWVAETPWMPKLHSAAEDRAFCAGIAGRTVLARRAGHILGFLTRHEEEVQCLHIAADARGQGVGAMLLTQAQRARPRLALWTFAANTGARRFYGRAGFVEVSGTAGDNDEGLPDIRMEWRRP